MSGIRRFIPIALAIVAAVAIALAGAGIAVARGSGPATGSLSGSAKTPGLARPACHLWVVVNTIGRLVRTGCPGTTTKLLSSTGNGLYQVVFPVRVRHCAYLATIGESRSGFVAAPGFIVVEPNPRPHHPRTVIVETWDTSVVPADRPFHLAVIC